MDIPVTRPRDSLVASARLKDDKTAIYTEEGTPIQDEEFPLSLIKQQLEANGATTENAVRFLDDLQKLGYAELRQDNSDPVFCWITAGDRCRSFRLVQAANWGSTHFLVASTFSASLS
jgi:hypothetical protein